MRVIKNDLGTFVQNAATKHIGASACHHSAIVHGATTGDRHILELDNCVRPNDTEHTICNSLANRRSNPLPGEDVCLDPGTHVADVEITRHTAQFVNSTCIASRQRISRPGREADDFCCTDCGVVVGCNQV
jgi:hypothetical protein